MDVIKASCPNCNTQYQLTKEQLSVANGQVRCGACMTVFKAVPPKQEAKPRPKKPEPKRSSFINDSDEKLLNDTSARKAFDKPSSFETGEYNKALLDDDLSDELLDKSPPAGANSDEDDLFGGSDSLFGDDDDIIGDSLADDSDDDLLDDFGSESSSIITGSEYEGEYDDDDDHEFLDIDIGDDDEASGPIKHASDDDEPAADESWAEQLLEDDDGDKDTEEDKPSTRKETKAASQDNGPKKALGSSADDFDDDFDLDELGLDAPLSLSKSEEDDLGFNEKDTLIERITPEPLEFQLFTKNRVVRNILMGFTSLVLIAGIVSQVLYFEFDSLARTPEWRGTYEMVCKQLDCQLPEKYSVDDISAHHLSVKSHSYFDDTLIVDAIITNHADISQPFPVIEMFFTNLDQDIIAARQFQPEEYLRGELANAKLMPSKQPVHLALEIDDPGDKATGYWIQLDY